MWMTSRPATSRRGSGHRFDAGVESALVFGSAILLNQAFACGLVDLRHGSPELGIGRFLVTRLDGLEHGLHAGAHARLERDVVQSPLFALAGAFLG